METFFASMALCERNPLVNGGFPSQRPVMQGLDVFFALRLNKTFKQTLQTLVMWDASALIMTSL